MSFHATPQAIADYMHQHGLIMIERRELAEITAECSRLRLLEKAVRNFAQADYAVREILTAVETARGTARTLGAELCDRIAP